jgi:hypothetical protein
MGVTAVVLYDLSDVARERQRHRLSTLPEVPSGATVVVVVGALAPDPEAARLLAEHEARLTIEVQAVTPYTARRWVDAVRTVGAGALL